MEPVLTIAAALSVKSPFNPPIEHRDAARKIHLDTFYHPQSLLSDHLSIVNAFNSWSEQVAANANSCKDDREADRGGYRYARSHFLSLVRLQEMKELRNYYRNALIAANLYQPSSQLLSSLREDRSGVTTADVANKGGDLSTAEEEGEGIDGLEGLDLMSLEEGVEAAEEGETAKGTEEDSTSPGGSDIVVRCALCAGKPIYASSTACILY